MEMIKFGGVPISVVIPPSKDAKAMGINKYDGEIRLSFPTCMATGITKAKAPTLFIKLEKNAVTPIRSISLTLMPPFNFMTQVFSGSMAPTFNSPLLTTKMAATVMTAGCENPEKACSGNTIPVNVNTNNAIKATISYLILLVTNKIKELSITHRITICCIDYTSNMILFYHNASHL